MRYPWIEEIVDEHEERDKRLFLIVGDFGAIKRAGGGIIIRDLERAAFSTDENEGARNLHAAMKELSREKYQAGNDEVRLLRRQCPAYRSKY